MFKSMSYMLFKINGRIISILLWFGINLNVNSQVIFYQDCFKGGVTYGGFSTGLGFGSDTINLYIEPGSVIKKAFLICQRFQKPLLGNIYINNTLYKFNSSNEILSFKIYNSGHLDHSGIHIIDITKNVTPNLMDYVVNIPFQNDPEIAYNNIGIIIFYQNFTLPTINTHIILNAQDLEDTPIKTYFISNINPINSNWPVGFSINSDRVGDTLVLKDGSKTYFNGNYIGLIGGTDSVNKNWTAGGVKGHFYYQNNALFGLDDDNPNIALSGSDGLVDVSSLIQSNSTTYNYSLIWQDSLALTRYNIYTSFFLAYTSPCDTFSVTHTPDTTVCHGAQLPLFVTGGQTYEWTPQVGLNCYDCPNPVFSADSTMHYSIRIWNNDSCSKVLPLHIVVEEALPHFDLDISPSECGDSTGSITITPALNGFSYINQTTQDTNTTGIFSGLESGFYPISIVNNSACSFDTVVFIPETLSVHAGFTASPNAGISPLPVAFTNTSSHANSYQWIYENQSSTQENINHIFQQDGIYPVMLIAYGNSILCADTAYDTIYVYLPIEVEIPNIFTPNSDQNNDQWGIKINVPAEVDLQIFNRWGEIVVNKKEEVLSPGFIPLWDGGKHVGGVYYYVIRVRTDFEKKEFKGNLTLVR